MKTPLSYYGGKQQVASKIVSLIPEHKIYCEPFVGGATVFFKKPPSQSKIINDINSEIINFYEVIQRDFSVLQAEVAISLHSRKLHKHVQVVYENPEMFDRIKKAWAVWMLGNCSFGNNLTAGFGYDRSGSTTQKLAHKRNSFSEDIAVRLQNVQIGCCDVPYGLYALGTMQVLSFILIRHTLVFLGHYDGYDGGF